MKRKEPWDQNGQRSVFHFEFGLQLQRDIAFNDISLPNTALKTKKATTTKVIFLRNRSWKEKFNKWNIWHCSFNVKYNTKFFIFKTQHPVEDQTQVSLIFKLLPKIADFSTKTSTIVLK